MFVESLTNNNIWFVVVSSNFSFIFERPVISKTIKHIDKWDNSAW